MTKNDQIFLNRLNEHPELRERIEGLLDMVKNETGNFTKANDAEQYAIDELRKMGNDTSTVGRKRQRRNPLPILMSKIKQAVVTVKKSPMAYNIRID